MCNLDLRLFHILGQTKIRHHHSTVSSPLASTSGHKKGPNNISAPEMLHVTIWYIGLPIQSTIAEKKTKPQLIWLKIRQKYLKYPSKCTDTQVSNALFSNEKKAN